SKRTAGAARDRGVLSRQKRLERSAIVPRGAKMGRAGVFAVRLPLARGRTIEAKFGGGSPLAIGCAGSGRAIWTVDEVVEFVRHLAPGQGTRGPALASRAAISARAHDFFQ